MTNTDPHAARAQSPSRRVRSVHGLMAATFAAWAATVWLALRMGNGAGTMGLGLAQFVGMWILMMGAMMLPSSWKLAAAEDGHGDGRRTGGSAVFAAGYLLVWAAAGIPAFALAVTAGHIAAHDRGAATTCAASALAVCGLYQFTRPKASFLMRCRGGHPDTSVALDADVRGPFGRGVRHGTWCVGASWAAMVLLVVFGVMNVAAMVVVAAALAAERLWFPGATFRRVMGLVSVAAVAVVIADPAVAAGLHHSATQMRM